MLRTAIFLGLTLVFCIVLSSPIVVAQRLDSDSDTPLTPSQMHEVLGRQKAEALDRTRRVLSEAATAAAASTQTNYDVLRYDIYIRVDDTLEILHGAVGFVARATESAVSEVEVDLFSDMAVDSIVSLAGVLGYGRTGDVITVVLDRSYDIDEEFEFTIHYNGHPVEGGLQAFAFDWRAGRKVIASLSEPYFARSWWPCKDRMDDKADSFNIAIEVDTSFYVGSNGSLDSVVAASANTHTYYYTVHYPMATYLFSLAIHPYAVWSDIYVYNDDQDTMPVVHAVYPDLYSASLTSYDITPQAIGIFAEHYGEYPFVAEKYGHANFEWGGAMEHQTMTSMVGSSFGLSERVIVHELSHQWWGDMVTCESWADIWLNEGWASYSEALYYLELDGWEHYHAYMDSMAYWGSGTVYCDDTTNVWRIFNGGLSYDKGAWVVHMLRGVLGDSLFYEGLDAYYNSEYQYGALTTEKFKNLWEEATSQELDWFFDEWVFGQYYPQYRYQYAYRWDDMGIYAIYLWVSQVQTTQPQVFTMPVDFFIDYVSRPDDTLTFMVDQRGQLFRFYSPSTVANVILDPAGWILQKAYVQSWTMHVITFDADLSEGRQYVSYSDTVSVIGGSGNFTVTITAGALPDGLSIDNTGIITGAPTDTGSFTFTVDFDDNEESFRDDAQLTIHVTPTELVPGDVNFLDALVDVGDLTYLIVYLFIKGPEPPVLNQADVNTDCVIDIGDVTYLIAYLFIEGEDPLPGCVD
ncbi:MAG TPA: M1 family aminopeptidase [Acidobacteriota bacterium]|nr:M1 family aminopeptidase [Acidobacteriota bacterium]